MPEPLTRRDALKTLTKSASVLALAFGPLRLSADSRGRREFNVRDFEAKGDGLQLDTAAFQRAIDAAAAAGAGSRVIVPGGGRRYLLGSVYLRGGIDLHLADDAELLASTRKDDYGESRAILNAHGGRGLRISGTGTINGRSPEFMESYDAEGEWWKPAAFRPRLVVLEGCKDLQVTGVTLRQAPNWTLHLIGCEDVLVEKLMIRNQLDVPNCDGIDPDHCRNVEIKKCDIACGDDAIVVKATRNFENYGGSSNIRVSDCVLETQDSGLKIGTETVRDIHDVRFERCQIRSSSRGCTIQLRDEGNVSKILFRDITFTSRYFADPWWGRGEAISFTAIPRFGGAILGRLSDVRVENVKGVAENSIRISGSPESRIQNVELENVRVTFDRWTKYRGGVWDNRPTTATTAIEEHPTPGIHVRHADRVRLSRCRVSWGKNRPEYFTHALEAEDVKELSYPNLDGEAAHPGRDPAVVIRERTV